MLISIITVTRNDSSGVQKTIASVLGQTYRDWELLICDGGSNVSDYKVVEAASSTDDRISIVSRSDKGIFDAMNKGAITAKGDFLVFLNGGDLFYDKMVLFDFAQLNLNNMDVVCGSVACSDNGRELKSKRSGAECYAGFFSGKMPPHQGMFIATSFFKNIGGYNTFYRIVGDFNLYLNARNKAGRFYAWNRVVSVFDLSGVSSTTAWLQEKERMMALIEHYGRLSSLLYLPHLLIRCLRNWVRVLLIKFGWVKVFREFKD